MNSSKLFAVLLVTVLYCKNLNAQVKDGTYITLYDDQWQQGYSETFEVNGCTNVPPQIDDRASSVDTQGNCVVLCADSFCEGRCEGVPGSSITDHGNFEAASFNDVVSSAKPC
ncbi:uncharacterized protein LOC116352110 [Contarinia nasturtii]|uniref:uncharacterized protein LOC116352110 n=1 Tax=Contarinia nasturtii TaxID=265458 RepID=UPI0012D3A25C|nr:uncharacterized protein LOC116352110 [Contarinia nasturtii]